MRAQISYEGRLLGFDPLEWLMLIVAVLLLGVVAASTGQRYGFGQGRNAGRSCS